MDGARTAAACVARYITPAVVMKKKEPYVDVFLQQLHSQPTIPPPWVPQSFH